MYRLPLACLVLCTATLSAQATPAPVANPHPYTTLYVFGDSYSDSGSGYVDSNGPTAVVYLAQHLGIPFTWYGDPASTGKSLNFAVAGALTGDGTGRRSPTGQFIAFGMTNQVDNFVHFYNLKVIPRIDPDNSMFFFAGGLNDSGRPDGYSRTNIEAEIDSLYALGGRRFMVALMPVKIPVFSAIGTKLNPELARIPAEERAKHPDIRIANSQWGPFFDDVITHPAKYGITNTTTPCAQREYDRPETPCASPGTHFYYHPGHPSNVTHRAVGEMLYQEAITKAP